MSDMSAASNLSHYYGSIEGHRGEVARVTGFNGEGVQPPMIMLVIPSLAGHTTLYLSRDEACELQRHLTQALSRTSGTEK